MIGAQESSRHVCRRNKDRICSHEWKTSSHLKRSVSEKGTMSTNCLEKAALCCAKDPQIVQGEDKREHGFLAQLMEQSEGAALINFPAVG